MIPLQSFVHNEMEAATSANFRSTSQRCLNQSCSFLPFSNSLMNSYFVAGTQICVFSKFFKLLYLLCFCNVYKQLHRHRLHCRRCSHLHCVAFVHISQVCTRTYVQQGLHTVVVTSNSKSVFPLYFCSRRLDARTHTPYVLCILNDELAEAALIDRYYSRRRGDFLTTNCAVHVYW